MGRGSLSAAGAHPPTGAPSLAPVELATIEEAVAALARGEMIVVVDAPDRENEGDLVIAAELVTPHDVHFMATHGRGLICVPMRAERLAALAIPPMVARGTDARGTAFHVGVDHRSSSTGISASERATTIRALVDPTTVPTDFVQPGHVFPLACDPAGVLRRAGHTEASIDLVTMAGLEPAAVICEVMGADGEMARLPELLDLAAHHGLLTVAISDVIAHRRANERLVERLGEARLPLPQGAFSIVAVRTVVDEVDHVALVLGELDGPVPPLVHVHAECLIGDVFGSCRCGCRRRLTVSLERIAAEGRGAVVYLRAGSARDDGADAQILRELGVTRVRLLTDDRDVRDHLGSLGVDVVERIPLRCDPAIEPSTSLELAASSLCHLR